MAAKGELLPDEPQHSPSGGVAWVPFEYAPYPVRAAGIREAVQVRVHALIATLLPWQALGVRSRIGISASLVLHSILIVLPLGLQSRRVWVLRYRDQRPGAGASSRQDYGVLCLKATEEGIRPSEDYTVAGVCRSKTSTVCVQRPCACHAALRSLILKSLSRRLDMS